MPALVVRDMMFSSNEKNKPYIYEEIRSLTWNTMVIHMTLLDPVTCLFWAPPRYLLRVESAAARMPANHYVTSMEHF